MSLSDNFNTTHRAEKVSDSVLQVYNGAFTSYYDFAQRFLYAGETITPFSQLDREVLILMRDRLVELKGNPPELPPESPASTSSARKFNL